MDLLQEIDEISKIYPIDRDDVDTIMIDFAKRITKTLKIERLSVWLLEENNTVLTSAAEYDARNGSFNLNTRLQSSDFPNYFKAIGENQIITAPDIKANPQTKELAVNYFAPNDVISLMDVPLRIEGELIGVMCFEKTGNETRTFTEKEQIFALSIGIVFASNLEARHRRRLQEELEKELKEKATLIKEIHHRVKNNFAVVAGLIGLQTLKSKDSYHEDLMNELRTKIISIAGIHEIVYNTNSYSEIDAHNYILKLTTELRKVYHSDKTTIEHDISVQKIELKMDVMIPVALIINEVLTNSYKHAFSGRENGIIELKMTEQTGEITLSIHDNGVGFKDGGDQKDQLGMEIIKSLVEQLEGNYTYESDQGSAFKMTFKNT